MTLHLLQSHLRLGYLQMKLFCILFVDNPVQNAEAINHDFGKKISNWASEWLVKFSRSKTKTMKISIKRKEANFPPLSISDEKIWKKSNCTNT